MVVEKIFDTSSLKINYAEGPANGAPLVLLHGASARWQDLNLLITELERHWQVYACDLRGHGRSDRANSYRMVDVFPDVVAFIRKCICVPTILAGHSLGGQVSIVATAVIPDLIHSLILLEPPLYLGKESIKSNYVYDYFLGVYIYLTKQRTAREVFSDKGAGNLLQVDQPARVLESIPDFTRNGSAEN
jgi:pimeloyl-ACP methyl ester carboxylesterase